MEHVGRDARPWRRRRRMVWTPDDPLNPLIEQLEDISRLVVEVNARTPVSRILSHREGEVPTLLIFLLETVLPPFNNTGRTLGTGLQKSSKDVAAGSKI
jgi:hypothetical protein